MTCEDFPCCGHTDGLGCDWVSPYEITPCDVCIEARASYPYHNSVSKCPTIRNREQADIPANSECGFEDNPDCEGDACCRVIIEKKEILACESCARGVEEYYEEMREIYYSR